MKYNLKDLNEKVEQALRNCLSRVPFARIEEITIPQTGNPSPDMIATISTPEGEKLLLVEIKINGQPRIARHAVNQLWRHLETFADSYGVFSAPYISPKAAEICVQENIGYLDLAGNGRLAFDKVYIERTGNPNPFAEKRDLRSLYSPKASRVLRVLLAKPKKTWKVQNLAKEARVSLGEVSNVKKLLHDREWTQILPGGFTLAEPESLLSEWAQNYHYRKNKTYDFYSLKPVPEIEYDIAKTCDDLNLKYALTGFSAAARLAPAVRYHRAMAYVQSLDHALLERLNLKETPTGANVTLLVPHDDGVFYGAAQFDEVQIVSAIQVYLDLLHFPARGEEAAKALFDKVIKPGWQTE
ncbi:hypothetical protein HZA56_01855 [Candidatus Poribacteria bacterium]|nr:hypothetical protein [Candidatus Poribacteria bacterium]